MSAAKKQTALKVSGYSFTYPEAAHCVFGAVDLELFAGEFVLLVGNTGSGKTTFLKSLLPEDIICGKRTGEVFLPSERGGERENSCETRRKTKSECKTETKRDGEREGKCEAPSIAYVSQSPENQLVCDVVWHELAFSMENYGVSRGIMRRRVAELSHFFGIEPWFHKNVNDLSGGQAQIVNLARAMATGPELLLLDEPTAQLDPVAEKNFLHALFRINRELGMTVVVATHTPENVCDYAHRAFELKDGKIQEVPMHCFQDGSQSEDLRDLHDPHDLHAKLGQASFAGANTTPDGTFNSGSANKSADKKALGNPEEVISLRDVHFRYHKNTPWVLRGLDMNLCRGEIRALVGGNGCGKTTALNLIAGIEKPNHGKLKNALQRLQAYMPQYPSALFVRDSVADEMREWQKSCGYADTDIQEMLERVGLSEKTQQHPFDLSGGQQQLLAFVKLLITKPSLLLLDEPTGGLDAHMKLVVANLILDYANKGGSVVFSTHDLSFAFCVAHTTTLIFDGQATCTEPSNKFFANNMFYRPTPNEFMRLFAEKVPFKKAPCEKISKKMRKNP